MNEQQQLQSAGAGDVTLKQLQFRCEQLTKERDIAQDEARRLADALAESEGEACRLEQRCIALEKVATAERMRTSCSSFRCEQLTKERDIAQDEARRLADALAESEGEACRLEQRCIALEKVANKAEANAKEERARRHEAEVERDTCAAKACEEADRYDALHTELHGQLAAIRAALGVGEDADLVEYAHGIFRTMSMLAPAREGPGERIFRVHIDGEPEENPPFYTLTRRVLTDMSDGSEVEWFDLDFVNSGSYEYEEDAREALADFIKRVVATVPTDAPAPAAEAPCCPAGCNCGGCDECPTYNPGVAEAPGREGPGERDESVPPPGWECYTFRDDDGVLCEALHVRRAHAHITVTLANAWRIYDAEHGYAPAAPASEPALPSGWTRTRMTDHWEYQRNGALAVDIGDKLSLEFWDFNMRADELHAVLAHHLATRKATR